MRNFNKIAVIGAGTMGHGIAQVFASFGYSTVVLARKEASLKKAEEMVGANLKVMLANDFITNEQAENTVKFLSYSTDYSTLKDADLIIEAVPEDKKAKADCIATIEANCSDTAVIASTTSAMNVFKVAKMKHPERMVIAHFNNPPHIVPLVELIAGPETPEDLMADMKELLTGIGKQVAVLNKYVPGFIVNRLTAALLRECSYLVDKGYCTAEDVDTAFKANQGLKASFEGPLELLDYIGWDVASNVGRLLYPFLCARITPSPMAKRMVKAGRLGIKSGKGLKDYSGKTREELQAVRTEKVIKILNTIRKFD